MWHWTTFITSGMPIGNGYAQEYLTRDRIWQWSHAISRSLSRTSIEEIVVLTVAFKRFVSIMDTENLPFKPVQTILYGWVNLQGACLHFAFGAILSYLPDHFPMYHQGEPYIDVDDLVFRLAPAPNTPTSAPTPAPVPSSSPSSSPSMPPSQIQETDPLVNSSSPTLSPIQLPTMMPTLDEESYYDDTLPDDDAFSNSAHGVSNYCAWVVGIFLVVINALLTV